MNVDLRVLPARNRTTVRHRVAALVEENFGVKVDAAKLKPVRKYPFLNAERVRKFLLETAKVNRPANRFTRVSAETLTSINAQVRTLLLHVVHRAPSKGRTI